MRMIIVAALLLAIGLQTSSAAITREEWERMVFYAACAPMSFAVTDLTPEGVRETGLTKQAIINAVESRLRGARLFISVDEQLKEQGQHRPQLIEVIVHIAGLVVSVDVRLKRAVKDMGYGLPGTVIVWSTSRVGMHGGNGPLILGTVSEILDEFLASYLRVNEAHCSR